MKSIKPGRGPSMMNGIGSIAAAVFGVFWTITAAGLGAGIFSMFGVLFIIIAVVQAVYSFKNAAGRNRYSEFDIVDGTEEPDPLELRFSPKEQQSELQISKDRYKDSILSESEAEEQKSRFCPYCGAKAEGDFLFCNQCGKKLP